MTEKEMSELGPGDVIVNRGSGAAYVVIDNRGTDVVAIRPVTVQNPAEWQVVLKHPKL